MDIGIPEEVDALVYGTGIAESVLAAALSQAGQKVLHIDDLPLYGSVWATHSLDTLRALLTAPRKTSGHSPPTSDNAAPGADGERLLALASTTQGAVRHGHVTEAAGADLGPSRSYALDLAPRLVLAGGDFVDLLIRSGTGTHLEFKLLQGTYVLQDGRPYRVPATKGDVFQDRSLAPLEKRALMRFMGSAQAHVAGLQSGGEEGLRAAGVDPAGRFGAYLEGQGLPARLRDMVRYAIALSPPDASPSAPTDPDPVTAAQGLARLAQYLGGIGRYGPASAPLLVPLYGTAELPQALCRHAAVKGATYVLRRRVEALVVGGEGQGAVVGAVVAPEAEGEAGIRVRCSKAVVAGTALAGGEAGEGEWASRAICITDTPIISEAELALLVIPPAEAASLVSDTLDTGAAPQPRWAAHVLQLGPTCHASPSGKYVIHVSAPALSSDARSDLAGIVSALVRPPAPESSSSSTATVDTNGAAPEALSSSVQTANGAETPPRPNALFLAYFQARTGGSFLDGLQPGLPSGVYATPCPTLTVDVDPGVIPADSLAGPMGIPGLSSAFGLKAAVEKGEGGDDSDQEDLEKLEQALGVLGGPASGAAGPGEGTERKPASEAAGKEDIVPT